MSSALSSAVLVIDASDLRVHSWNEAAGRMFDIKREDAGHRFCWEVVGGVDARGARFCQPDCPLAQKVAAADMKLLVRNGPKRRPTDMSSYLLTATGEDILVHVFKPERKSSALRERAPSRASALLTRASALPPALTPRQREILLLLGDGATTRVIASRLGISEHTVHNHVRKLLEALGAKSRLQAISKARRLELL